MTGGSATNASGAAVPGTFAFANPNGVPNAGMPNAAVIFTPADSLDYSSILTTVNLVVLSPFATAPASFAVTLRTNQSIITLHKLPNYTYYIQRTTNLTAGSGWVTISTNTADTNGFIRVTPFLMWVAWWPRASITVSALIPEFNGKVQPHMGTALGSP